VNDRHAEPEAEGEMIPYVGSKRSIAAELLAVMPSAEHFYDLFGGGGAVTEAAAKLQYEGIFKPWKKWQHIHYNEINTGVYELNKKIWNGTFDFEAAKKLKVTKETFEQAKKNKNSYLDAFILIYHSYANMELSYFNNSRKVNGYLSSTKKSKNIEVICTNEDYRNVPIEPNSIVYCDIPYNAIASIKRGVYGIKFDYAAFYEWARTRDFPVYFSDYAAEGFECVWEKEVVCRLNFSKRTNRTEKLFWNGVKICH